MSRSQNEVADQLRERTRRPARSINKTVIMMRNTDRRRTLSFLELSYDTDAGSHSKINIQRESGRLLKVRVDMSFHLNLLRPAMR